MSDFDMLGLAPNLNAALQAAGISSPTPIQKQAIPVALNGEDVLGLAQTGTGKTLAFGLPLVEHLLNELGRPEPKSVKALILAPTRELANQITANIKPLIHNTPLKITTVVGGQSIHKQVTILAKGLDILVATPGRLIDLMERKAVNLSTVGHLVLDEADQMLDLGFIHALRQIAPKLGTPRQTMLFSATMSKQMEELAQTFLTKPKRIQVAPPGKTADKVEQEVLFLDKARKPFTLRQVLDRFPDDKAIVFSRTKHGAEKTMKQLVQDGYSADSVHGNKSQGQRDRAIRGFKNGDVRVLVATDVAARGIDIPGVGLVVNYDLPNVPESYVHRIGRTARAGRDGVAISLCSPDEIAYLRDIEKLIGRNLGAAKNSSADADATPSSKRRPKHRGNKSGASDRAAHPQDPNGRRGAPGKPNGPKRRRPRRTSDAVSKGPRKDGNRARQKA